MIKLKTNIKEESKMYNPKNNRSGVSKKERQNQEEVSSNLWNFIKKKSKTKITKEKYNKLFTDKIENVAKAFKFFKFVKQANRQTPNRYSII